MEEGEDSCEPSQGSPPSPYLLPTQPPPLSLCIGTPVVHWRSDAAPIQQAPINSRNPSSPSPLPSTPGNHTTTISSASGHSWGGPCQWQSSRAGPGSLAGSCQEGARRSNPRCQLCRRGWQSHCRFGRRLPSPAVNDGQGGRRSGLRGGRRNIQRALTHANR